MSKLVKPAVYDYSARRRVTESLCAEYEFIKRSIIGRSCGGRDIPALKIGSAAEYSLIAGGSNKKRRLPMRLKRRARVKG